MNARPSTRVAVPWAPSLAAAALLSALAAPSLVAQHDSVVVTVHNLSVFGPGEIRSLDETRVCKFCHVPHNAQVPSPLWGHTLSQARYEVPLLRAGGERPAPQPDGSSRLCLSCHDGTIALGDVAGGRIPMAGAPTLTRGRRGYIGTDLTGSHPVSFAVPDGNQLEVANSDSDMALRSLAEIAADPEVKLDVQGKMQCTTCHDPHADRYYQPGRVPRFWVKTTVDGVCLTCHTPR
jgi:hypothetical protein